MGKVSYKRLKGSQGLRMRLLLATLSSTPVLIEEIHADDALPGLRPHEISLLHLFEKVSDDCHVEINETGTKFKYKPGIVMGGRHLVHDCGLSRSIGYFLEPLMIVALFAKKPLSITLKGITNDSKDICVDTFRYTVKPILEQFGVAFKEMTLQIKRGGAPPLGGGEVMLSMPIVRSLTAVGWIDEGFVERIRGYSFSARVSGQFEIAMQNAAHGILDCVLKSERVYIHSDHKDRIDAGNLPGYGICLMVETTSGCRISADTAVSYACGDDIDEMEDEDKKELLPPEDVGEQVASILLQEIEQGGVVDSAHRGLLFLLCALCPPGVSKVRVGKLSPYGIETLRLIRDFLGVKFVIKPDPSSGTVILKCVGSGLKNLSRKISQ